MEQLRIDYDKYTDVLTVDGIRYSAELFRIFAFCKQGTWLRLEKRQDGVVTVSTPGPELERKFDAIAGNGTIF